MTPEEQALVTFVETNVKALAQNPKVQAEVLRLIESPAVEQFLVKAAIPFAAYAVGFAVLFHFVLLPILSVYFHICF